MLKWTVQQRRKSAADIGDVLLLGLLAQAPAGCSDVDGISVRPQPQLRKRGPMRHAAVSLAEPSTPALCVPQSSRLSGAVATTRPRSASPRFNTAADAVNESSPRCGSRLAASLQVVRQCSQVEASAAKDSQEFAASDVSAAARRRFSLTPTVYRRAAAAAREATAAAVAAASSTAVGSGCGRSASPAAVAAPPLPRHSPPAGSCLPAAILSAGLAADPDAATAALGSLARGATAPSLGEPELMCVATATSATPKVAKLRRLRPAMQCRRNCAPLATSHDGASAAAAERGETRRAATPDSGVGVALSEGESVPSDEDAGADACGCHPFSDAQAVRRTATRRGSAGRVAPDDYIDADFRIQRSSSDSAATAAQRPAAEGLRSCSIGRCNSSPRLADGRERRDICDVVAPTSLRHPRITFTPAVAQSDDGAAALKVGNRRCSLTVVITDDAPDQDPLHIPRCLTADASLGRPRALARRRLSDCGRVDRENGIGESQAAGHCVPGHDPACEPLSWARQRHLHHLSARDWREVTI